MLIAFVHTTFYPTRGKCVPAIVNAIWETVVLASLPSGHITINNSETIKLKVVAMSTMPKIIATILIAVPLVCLELASAYVGMRFLMYCHALGELLVKALSLSYIQTVPGVVFVSWAHEIMKHFRERTLRSDNLPVFPIRRTFETWQAYWSSDKLKIILTWVASRLAYHRKHFNSKWTSPFWHTSSKDRFTAWNRGSLESLTCNSLVATGIGPWRSLWTVDSKYITYIYNTYIIYQCIHRQWY